MKAAATTTRATPQELLDLYYYKGWNKNDESAIRDCLAKDVKFQVGFGKTRRRGGHEGFLEYMRTTHNAIGRHFIKIDDVIVNAEGTKASVRLTNRGIHKGSFFGVAGSGHEISWAATAFFTFGTSSNSSSRADGDDDDGDDGRLRITEIWAMADTDSLKRQIGASVEAVPFSNSQNGVS